MDPSFRSEEPIERLAGNVHTLVPMLIALAAWLFASWKKMRAKRPGEPAVSGDEAGRTQRVQDEVRRKIAERRGELMPIDPFGGPPRRAEAVARRLDDPPRVPPPRVQPPRPDFSDEQAQAAVARSERLSAQVRALDQAAANVKSWVVMPEPPAGAVSPWLAELREPASFRRALILREVLGAPVALR
jgi:hypothetical protein